MGKELVVVITGASCGIGRATALRFAREGAAVVLAARRAKPLRELTYECGEKARLLIVPTDVTDERAVRRLASRAIHRFGRIDVWVNNAAVTLFSRFEDAPPEAFRRVMETNLFGYIHGARAVIPHFRRRGFGILINVSSQVARHGSPFLSAYAASKSGIRGLSESLRQELAGEGIHVCTVLPASIDTPFFRNAANFTGRAVQPVKPILPAEKAANSIAQLAERPRREVFVGRAGQAAAMLSDLAPALFRIAAPRVVRKEHFEDAPAEASAGNLFSPSQYDSISGGWRHPLAGQGLRAGAAALRLTAGAVAGWLLLRKRRALVEAISASVRSDGSAGGKALGKAGPRARKAIRLEREGTAR